MKMGIQINVCVTCLSKDRSLIQLNKMEPLIKEIKCIELKSLLGGICWECQRVIWKIQKFRHQVQTVQEILMNHLWMPIKCRDYGKSLHFKEKDFHNSGLSQADDYDDTEIYPLSTLVSKVNRKYDFEFNYDFNSLTSNDDNSDLIKEDTLDNDKSDEKTDQVDDYVDNGTIENTTTEEESANELGINEQGDTLEFTEEEMVMNTEEKRCDLSVLSFIREQAFDDHMKQKQDEYQIYPHSTLGSNDNRIYNNENCHSIDPLTSDEPDLPIKEESLDFNINDEQRDAEEKTTETINVQQITANELDIHKQVDTPAFTEKDMVRSNKTRQNKRKDINVNRTKTKSKQMKHSTKYDIDLQESKFVQIILTREEMMRNREEKKNHHNYKKIPYKCDLCVLGFMRKKTFDVHMEKKHDENLGPHTCEICQSRFPNIGYLWKHRSKHYVYYKCKLCKHESSEQWALVAHCKTKHTEDAPNKIHCNQCEVIVKSPKDLEEHIQTEHRLYCNECGVKFKGKNTLRRHKARIHATEREFVCDICTKTFVSKTRLETHIVSHNEALARRLAFCEQCGVQYKNIYVYRNHLKYSANHTERLYSCSKCNKRFVSKVYRNLHYKFYHLKKSHYQCELCNKLFISDCRLKNHKQLHHGYSRTRNYPCNDCEKKFFTMSSLRGHQLTHSDQRSFMCEDCGDTFKQRPALYTHARLVHKRETCAKARKK